jgi:hypothetical protein
MWMMPKAGGTNVILLNGMVLNTRVIKIHWASQPVKSELQPRVIQGGK